MPRYFVHVLNDKFIVDKDGEGQQTVLRLCFSAKEMA
jgi:hypothetical protein